MKLKKSKDLLIKLVFNILFPTIIAKNFHKRMHLYNPSLKKLGPLLIIFDAIAGNLLSPIIMFINFNYVKSFQKYRKIHNSNKPLKIQKIGIYSPWFDKYSGGGEKVAAFFAQYFENYFPEAEVHILCDNFLNNKILKLPDLDQINLKFNTNLISTKIIWMENNYNYFFVKKYYDNFLHFTEKYDLLLNCHMNLNPSAAALNLHYIHFPMENHIAGSSIFHKLYLESYQLFMANSNFTKKWTNTYNNKIKNIHVVYPPVSIKKYDFNQEKRFIILTCGRFTYEKSYKFLIECFKKYQNEYFNDFEFYIVGSLNPKKKSYFDSLVEFSKGYKIKFITNMDYNNLMETFKFSMFYWHSMGVLVDADVNPLGVEHFGISLIEAMSSGCVPIVINKGGPAEIVTEDVNGCKWLTMDELAQKTFQLINDPEKYKKLQLNAVESSQQYCVDNFYKNFDSILKPIINNN
jgi:glycosyltransferase involved in cell wall biosynthesis